MSGLFLYAYEASGHPRIPLGNMFLSVKIPTLIK
jgi:hypothetical protein